MTVKQLQAFVLWLRKERISYSHLSAGGITLDGVVDLKAVDEAKATPEEPRKSVYQKFGAGLYEQPTVKKSEAVPEEAQID